MAISDINNHIRYFEELKASGILGRSVCVVAVKDTPINPKHAIERLSPMIGGLGLKTDFTGKYRASYIAVIINGNVVKEALSENGRLEEQLGTDSLSISVSSAGLKSGNSASVKINGIEYAANLRGFNIVLFDIAERCLTDSIAIDSFSDYSISRKYKRPQDTSVAMLGQYKNANLGGQLTVLASYQTIKDMGYPVIMLRQDKNSPAPEKLYNKICRFSKNSLTPEPPPAWSGLFDKYILCSDWTLAKKFGPPLPLRLFDWVNDGKSLTAFSASFGTPDGNHNKKFHPALAASLKRFSALGIREKAGVDFCKSIGVDTAVYLPDPIFSQRREFYNRIIDMYSHKAPEHEYAAVYLLDMNPETVKLAVKIAGRIGLKPFFIVALKDRESVSLLDGLEYFQADANGVPDWLYYIANSSYTITNSFHALCMSLIFRKDFAAVDRIGWSNMRLLDFLARLSAEKKYITSEADIEASVNTVIDFDIVDELLREMYIQTRDFISGAMAAEPVSINSHRIDILPADQCCGCFSCASACPKNCISAVRDERTGFLYPKINTDECVSCGLCRTACPVLNNPVPPKKQLPIYSGFSLDMKTRRNSSSGGFFYELAAELITRKNAVVFGAGYDTPYKVRHMEVETTDDLEKIMQSKYVQSETFDTFRKVGDRLREGRTVMFCGTPCQCAGLAQYVQAKHINRDELYIVDFICSRVNSPRAYEAYLHDIEEQYGKKASSVKFRDKKKSWQTFNMLVSFEDGDKPFVGYLKRDNFLKGFLDHTLYPRPSCEICRFRGFERISDLTIMDAWGIALEKDMKPGASSVFIQSAKGQELFDAIKDRLYLEEKTKDDVKLHNGNITGSRPAGAYSEYFYERLDRNVPFSQILNEIDTGNFTGFVGKLPGVEINGAAIERHPDSEIAVGSGGCLELNAEPQLSSGGECRIMLENGARIIVNGRFRVCRGACIIVRENAVLTLGEGCMSAGAVIDCALDITIGSAVIERDVYISDSDMYEVCDSDGKPVNPAAPVKLGKHVRIGQNATVQKGAVIGDGSCIGAKSLVRGEIPANCLAEGVPAKVIMRDITWK